MVETDAIGNETLLNICLVLNLKFFNLYNIVHWTCRWKVVNGMCILSNISFIYLSSSKKSNLIYIQLTIH